MNGTPSNVTSPAATPGELSAWRYYLHAALEGHLDVPPLSRTSADIAAMAADGEANTAVLARLIELDPAVAANVLRVANSAALAPRIPVVTIPQAIAWLGTGEIQSIATSVVVRSRLFAGGHHDALLRKMWRRAVATAYWAREIARPRQQLVDLAHLCGLLGRIGRPVVLRSLLRAPDGADAALDDPRRLRLVDEFESLAGIALCKVWSLPEPVSTAIRHWRDEAFGGGWERQLRQVRLADLLASRMLDADPDPLLPTRIEAAITALHLRRDEIEGLAAGEAVVRQALDALTG
ncbi:MAG: HDOD domain-containing protein [Steroidobacteraceae bacterium]|jgi:HD-like signal output (HDOD) protein|nr:HDOD domain-containing protein [Steroidobacteraceae bacterium]